MYSKIAVAFFGNQFKAYLMDIYIYYVPFVDLVIIQLKI